MTHKQRHAKHHERHTSRRIFPFFLSDFLSFSVANLLFAERIHFEFRLTATYHLLTSPNYTHPRYFSFFFCTNTFHTYSKSIFPRVNTKQHSIFVFLREWLQLIGCVPFYFVFVFLFVHSVLLLLSLALIPKINTKKI